MPGPKKDTFFSIWAATHLNYTEKLDGLATLCGPCAHCGGSPWVGHSDYSGDYYTGDMFTIICSICGVGTDSEEWSVVSNKWNRRIK